MTRLLFLNTGQPGGDLRLSFVSCRFSKVCLPGVKGAPLLPVSLVLAVLASGVAQALGSAERPALWGVWMTSPHPLPPPASRELLRWSRAGSSPGSWSWPLVSKVLLPRGARGSPASQDSPLPWSTSTPDPENSQEASQLGQNPELCG